MNKKTIALIGCMTGSLLVLTVNAQVKPKTSPIKTTGKTRSPIEKIYEQGFFTDTAQPKMVTKEISYDVPAEKGATIQVNNTICNLDIRPWAETKVMIVTTVTIEEKLATTLKTNEELLEAGGISVRSFGNRIDIQARSLARFESLRENVTGYPSGTTHTIEGQQQWTESDRLVYTDLNRTKVASEFRSLLAAQNKGYWTVTGRPTNTMIIFVPEGSKLDIDNKNTAILINANIGIASFKMSHSNLDARSFTKLTVIGDYYNINISNVEEAELELENGTFTAGIVNFLDLDSENSEIEYERGTSIYMRSQSDRITIDEISKVDGRKLYGELRIGKLIASLDIEGTNADIKIRNILPLVDKIRITDKYADLRFPVRNLTNYAVSFHGENSTVFAPFEKIAAPPDPAEKTADKEKAKLVKPETSKVEKLLSGTFSDADQSHPIFRTFNDYRDTHPLVGEKAPVKFTAAAGDITGKHTRFEIVCHQCSVDFK